MSYANGTQFYNLPQTVGTDKRDWFDCNVAFAAIDAALHAAVVGQAANAEAISTINSKLADDESAIAALQTASSSHETQISTLQTVVNGQATQIADVRQDAEDMISANNEGAAATSTRAYAIGDYFIYNDVLYKATAAITIGDTIVPNTNCKATNVDTEITEVKSDLADVNIELTQWHTSDDLLIQFSEKSTKSIDLTQIDAKEFTVLFNGVTTGTRVVIKIPNIYIASSRCYYYGGASNGLDNIYAVCKLTDGVLTFTGYSKQGVDDESASMRVLY